MRIVKQISALLTIVYVCIDPGYAETNNCGLERFRCRNGECIAGELLCDGKANCRDSSDETQAECMKPESLPPVRPGTTSTTTEQPSVQTPGTKTCKAPPQPENGHWKLHRSQCSNTAQNCDISEGVNLGLGSHLVYSCNPGYKIRGSTDVSCSFEGKWLNIPICTEVRCKALSTASINADCRYDGEWVSCDSPVLPRTWANLNCRNSYQRESSLLSRRKDRVRCNENGQWKPEPIRCVPGLLTINIYLNNTKLVLNTTLNRNNAAFIEILDDRVIIHTNVKDPNYPNIDVR